MTNTNSSGGDRLATLLKQFQSAPSATAADRAARDQLLDELQESVGLAGKMVTEQQVVRRAENMLQGR